MLSEEEKIILDSIPKPEENNPLRPEFPWTSPKFPATPTIQIEVPGFSNVWIKDESMNPTGTHKDRMAWEMVLTYRNILVQKEKGLIKRNLPSMSLISSGSAAVAIQKALSYFKLPNLKVLADIHTEESIVEYLKKIGCEVYQTDLSKKPLSWKEILQITNNDDGIEITSNQALGPTQRFYDWLTYEILNTSPEYCFIPFGTGHLYENILNINKNEISNTIHDPRFTGNTEVLQNCNFIGVTTNNSKSKATKLYSPHLPFVHFDEQWIQSFKYGGFCGSESDVFLLQEKFLDEAIEIAKQNNINCEPSGITGLAMLLQLKEKIPKDSKIVIVNTGKTKYD
jgi:hypothetical protein